MILLKCDAGSATDGNCVICRQQLVTRDHLFCMFLLFVAVEQNDEYFHGELLF